MDSQSKIDKTSDDKNKDKRQGHHVMIFGASSGIALEFARPFAAKKARFTLVARDEDKLKDISADLYTRGARDVSIVAYSLDSLEGSYEATRAIIKQTDAPDTALIAQGILGDNEELLHSPKKMEQMLQINVMSPVGIMMALEESMVVRGKGTIAVFSSVAGDRGRASNFAYGSSKALITAFTSGMRARLTKSGVNVLTIKPGMVATAMTDHLPRSPLMANPKAVANDIIKAITKHEAVVYTPSFWRFIMFIISHLPEGIFRRLKF